MIPQLPARRPSVWLVSNYIEINVQNRGYHLLNFANRWILIQVATVKTSLGDRRVGYVNRR
jgi:hypothetical protein